MAEEEEEEDDLAGEMPELDQLTVVGDNPAAPELDRAVVRRFLSRQRALDIAATVIRPLVPADQVEDLAADAVVRALKARPPRVEAVLPGWLAEIARRVAIRWLEKRKRRAQYEGPMPVAGAQEDAYTGHAVESHAEPVRTYFDEEGADEAQELVDDFLESVVAAHDRPVLELLRERADKKKTNAQLAAERNMSVDQLDRKIRRFKTKYAPRVRKRRTMMLLLKLGAGFVLAAAVGVFLYYWLQRPLPRTDVLPDPETKPLAPSATASVEAPLVASPTELARAKVLRDAALAACKANKWPDCIRGLDAARAIDPEGDDTPEVQNERAKAAALGNQLKPTAKP
jgi:DNA-directed RNA polymerase specialized sigma24 family protein